MTRAIGGRRGPNKRRTTMTAIKATAQGGRLELTVPPDWPDGTEVIVRPVRVEETFGLREEDWPTTPEALGKWRAWEGSRELLIFTDEQRAAWETARREQNDFEKATFDQRAEKLRRMWP